MNNNIIRSRCMYPSKNTLAIKKATKTWKKAVVKRYDIKKGSQGLCRNAFDYIKILIMLTQAAKHFLCHCFVAWIIIIKILMWSTVFQTLATLVFFLATIFLQLRCFWLWLEYSTHIFNDEILLYYFQHVRLLYVKHDLLFYVAKAS